MRKRNPGPARKAKPPGTALLFLSLALVCFGLDLVHFTHHLRHDPSLLALPGVAGKILWKSLLCLTVFFLLGFSRQMLLLAGFLFLFPSAETALGAATHETCERARDLMTDSGMARDAKEDFLGRLKIKPPRGTFPPEMDKVTWWGTFKPFEFWGNPELEALWINPGGQPVERQSFRAGRCELAKTSLKVEGLPQKRLQAGMWRVIVSCQDVVIDNHPFAVVGSSPGSPDAKGGDSGMMIWADDVS